MKKYVCTVCAWIYDPAVGDPDSGIAPGTPFEDIPEDWTCPICGVGKEALLLTSLTPYPNFCVLDCSVVSNSLLSHRLQPARLLGPWDF